MSSSHHRITFRRADSWLLYAIGLASRERRASLAEVIAAADAVNHAIMTFEEFDSALAKLKTAKLVVVRGKTFALSAKAKRLYYEQVDPKPTLMDQWNALHELLGAVEGPSDPRWRDPEWRNEDVTAGEFREAVVAYARLAG
jgi:hypothetical protein